MISVFINSLTSGGAEKVVLTLLDQFKQSQDKLELIMIEKVRFYELPENVSVKYLTRYESLERGILKFPYLFVCAWRLKKLANQPHQIIQSHLLRASFINILAKMLGSKHHAQIVVHSRINFDHKPFWYQVLAKWIFKQIFKRADSIVSICKVMKNELDDYLNLKNHPMHLAIYNPHHLAEIQSKALVNTPGFVFEAHKQYLISVGRLVKGKRIDDQIKALGILQKDFPNTELLIIGDGVLKGNLEDLATELNLRNKVHFLGFQQNPFAYLAKSDVLLLSSEWEGLPNILIEAMACGTAVVSADCISGPREIIQPDGDLSRQLKDQNESGSFGMLYPVGDINLLVNCITQILNDNNLKNSFIEKGLERAKDFDQKKISKQYLELFKNISHPSKSDPFKKNVTAESPRL